MPKIQLFEQVPPLQLTGLCKQFSVQKHTHLKNQGAVFPIKHLKYKKQDSNNSLKYWEMILLKFCYPQLVSNETVHSHKMCGTIFHHGFHKSLRGVALCGVAMCGAQLLMISMTFTYWY